MLTLDDNTDDFAPPDGMAAGLIPRDFQERPVGYLYCAKAFDLPLMTDGEIEAAIRREAAEGCLLEKLAHEMPILNQSTWGYCWYHSVTMGVQLIRGMNNLPFIPLSAFAGAAIIKNYRNQGGSCDQALDNIAVMGIPSQALWPQGQVDRRLDTAAMRADAATRKVTEWMDLDPTTMKRQHATALLNGFPVPSDRMWWRHSTCDVRVISWNPYTIVTKNSWAGWGDNGLGKISGNRAIPDGANCPRVMTLS